RRSKNSPCARSRVKTATACSPTRSSCSRARTDSGAGRRSSPHIGPAGPPPAMTTSAERPAASVIVGRGCEISERILFHVRLIDHDPAGPGEAMRRSGNPFQAAVAWQAKIETGSNLLPLNEHERQLGLRLPGDQRVPQKHLVNRAVVQEFTCNRW